MGMLMGATAMAEIMFLQNFEKGECMRYTHSLQELREVGQDLYTFGFGNV
jgi:hypothetical protein